MGDCLPEDALEQAEQRLVCPGCGYSRHVSYLIPRPGLDLRRPSGQIRL